MPEEKKRYYVEGECTCGTPYRVYVTPVPVVMKMIGTGMLQQQEEEDNHTIVFYCEGCSRKKTVEYRDSDVHRESAGEQD